MVTKKARQERMVGLFKRSSKRNSGASMVEAAISLPIFFFLILIFIDLCRICISIVFLHYAAHIAVDLATKTKIDVDTTSAGCTAKPAECSKFNTDFDNFVGAVSPSTSRAYSTILLVANPPGSPSGATLEKFRMFDNPTYSSTYTIGSQITAKESAIVVLRPGEKAMNVVTGAWKDHSSWSFGTGANQGWPGVGNNLGMKWDLLLETQPVLAYVEMHFEPVTPGFPSFQLSGAGAGYRTTQPFGFSTRPPTATPSVTITSTPTVAPTDTTKPPNPTATISPIPTSTATGTITSTPSITPTPLDTATITPTGTTTLTPTAASTPTITATPTATGTVTGTGTPTITLTPTLTGTITPTESPTLTGTITPTPTISLTPTKTPTQTATRTATLTATVTPTSSATATVIPTATGTTPPCQRPVCNCGNLDCADCNHLNWDCERFDNGELVNCCVCCYQQGSCGDYSGCPGGVPG